MDQTYSGSYHMADFVVHSIQPLGSIARDLVTYLI